MAPARTLGAVALVAAGFADFPLIAYHFRAIQLVPEHWIPTMFAVAMAVDAASALFFGRLYDRKGFWVLILVFGITAVFAPFVYIGGYKVFVGSPIPAIIGMSLWGIGMGAQESIMRAAVADLVPPNKRGTAYGLFHTGFGVRCPQKGDGGPAEGSGGPAERTGIAHRNRWPSLLPVKARRCDMESEVFSLEQACGFLKVSAKTLIRILREDHIPARKIGREWRFSRQALVDWISRGDSTKYAAGQEEEYVAFDDRELPTEEILEGIKSHLAALEKSNDVRSILPSLERSVPLPQKANLYTNYKQKRGIEKIQFEIYWNLRDERKFHSLLMSTNGLPDHEKPT